MAKKWLDSIDKQKRRINLKERDTQTESTTKNPIGTEFKKTDIQTTYIHTYKQTDGQTSH